MINDIFIYVFNKKRGIAMNTYNVLVVEDEKEIADAIEIYLKNQGYRVFKGSN